MRWRQQVKAFKFKAFQERGNLFYFCFLVCFSARIYDLLDLKETLSLITVEEENRIDCCTWSNDGRLLAITGSSGNIYIYLTRLNMLASVWQPLGTVAVLTSLKEVELYTFASILQIDHSTFTSFR